MFSVSEVGLRVQLRVTESLFSVTVYCLTSFLPLRVYEYTVSDIFLLGV